MNDSKTGGIWNYDEKENHINYLELLAVFYALKAFQCQLPSLQLLSRLSLNLLIAGRVPPSNGA